MASLNMVQLIGNLGDKPTLRKTPTNQDVANFSMATKESYMKDGQKVEHTEWHRIVAWGKTAELVGRYLQKGSCIYLEGKLQTRKFTNKQGQEQYTTEIVASSVQFLDRKPTDAVSSTDTFHEGFDASQIPF